MNRASLILNLILLFHSALLSAQCTPTGDEVSYGSGSWIGYVYEAQNNFTTGFYIGFITQTENFNQTFSGDSLYTSDCATQKETFSIRYKMNQTFACGQYTFTIGGDDGVRLSLDGGATWFINGYVNQPYTTYSNSIFLDGNYDLVLEYYEAYGQERVSFSYVTNGIGSTGGEIGSNQVFCSAGTVDPAAFTSVRPGGFCPGGTDSVSYVWQESADNVNFSAIAGASNETYDYPNTFPFDSTVYFRRLAVKGTDTALSNVISVQNNVNPSDESEVGLNEWIGHVYNETAGFSTINYVGTVSESERFDQSFGGNNATISTSGCATQAQTFTVRYKMQKTFDHGVYEFTIGGDDGVRLSLDGGSTYLINDWSDHGYRTRNATDTLNGTYNLVLDYYENGGGNRVSFDYVQQTPLPISLVYFDGSLDKEGQVNLHWKTASEINNDFFLIQKSIDQVNYESIGRVKGAGTTNQQVEYSFEDQLPCLGICWYRLLQVDFDGKETTYGPVIILADDQPTKLNQFVVFPNPSNGQYVKGISPYNTSEFKIQVFDLFGKTYPFSLHFQEQNNTHFFLSFPTQLQKGIFIIQYSYGPNQYTQRLLVY